MLRVPALRPLRCAIGRVFLALVLAATMATIAASRGGLETPAAAAAPTVSRQSVVVPGVDPLCVPGQFIPKPAAHVAVSTDYPNLAPLMVNFFLGNGAASARAYSRAEIAAGAALADGVNVLVTVYVPTFAPVSQGYVDGVRDLVASGASVIADYDAAALLFDDFAADIVWPAVENFYPAVALFSGTVHGGGALIPASAAELHFVDPQHPMATGFGPVLARGVRLAFSFDGFNASWLHTVATFDSIGFGSLNPPGTYPGILAGRCGAGRVVLFGQETAGDMIQTAGSSLLWVNALDFVTGVTTANLPPVADAGADRTVECAGPAGTTVTLEAPFSYDPDGDPLSFSWSENGQVIGAGAVADVNLHAGVHTVTLTVMDDQGLSDSDELSITVEDTAPPVLSGLAPIIVGQESDAGIASSSIDFSAVTALDACEGALPVANDAPALLPPGDTLVTFTAIDSSGNAASGSLVVTVLSAADMIDDLEEAVEAVLADGSVNTGQAGAMTLLLDAALGASGAGNDALAVTQLKAFIHLVEGMINAGMPQEESDALIAAANAAIAQILGGG